jgi:hypothetical protein
LSTTIVVDRTRNGVPIGLATISSGKPGHVTPTGVLDSTLKDVVHPDADRCPVLVHTTGVAATVLTSHPGG